MWPDHSEATAITNRLIDTAWDIATLEARIGASWEEARQEEAFRIQDIELEITDHCPAKESEDPGWPFKRSPCRLFGSRRRKRNSMGELAMNRSCTSLTHSAEFGIESREGLQEQSERASGHRRLEGWHPNGSRVRGNIKSMGRHRSFDEVDETVMRKQQLTVTDRPGIHRAMSIDEVEQPDQFSSSTKRRRGRRPTPQSVTEPVEVPTQSPQRRNLLDNPERRDLLKLLREKKHISEEDLQSRENRKLLHCIIYQQKMGVCFPDLAAHVNEDIENDPEEAFLRPPIPLFLDQD